VGGGLLGGGLFDCLHGEAVAAHVSQGSGDGRNAGGNRLAAMREGMRVLCWKQLSFAMIFPSPMRRSYALKMQNSVVARDSLMGAGVNSKSYP
jgi:hypothetical protein